MTMKFGFGQPLTRKEDDPLLRGAGAVYCGYCARGHAACRSPAFAARACPFPDRQSRPGEAIAGVRLLLTGDDVGHLGPLPTPGVLPGVDIKVPPYPILATEIVRYVGDAVAFVVADTVAAAKDAAEAIEVDWQPLPHIIGAANALRPGAPLVWPDRSGNSGVRDFGR